MWFRYDDEMEYVARARRSDIMIRQYQANSLAGQPIITSLLIDDAGIVQGYRIVNNPRIEAGTRIAAFGLADIFKGIGGLGLNCTDLPLEGGERPIEDFFVKQVCEKTDGGRKVHVEARRYYKAGQFAVDPNENRHDRKSVRKLGADRSVYAAGGEEVMAYGAACLPLHANSAVAVRHDSGRSRIYLTSTGARSGHRPWLA